MNGLSQFLGVCIRVYVCVVLQTMGGWISLNALYANFPNNRGFWIVYLLIVVGGVLGKGVVLWHVVIPLSVRKSVRLTRHFPQISETLRDSRYLKFFSSGFRGLVFRISVVFYPHTMIGSSSRVLFCRFGFLLAGYLAPGATGGALGSELMIVAVESKPPEILRTATGFCRCKSEPPDGLSSG